MWRSGPTAPPATTCWTCWARCAPPRCSRKRPVPAMRPQRSDAAHRPWRWRRSAAPKRSGWSRRNGLDRGRQMGRPRLHRPRAMLNSQPVYDPMSRSSFTRVARTRCRTSGSRAHLVEAGRVSGHRRAGRSCARQRMARTASARARRSIPTGITRMASNQHRPQRRRTREVAKFDALASRWWDPDGDFRPLARDQSAAARLHTAAHRTLKDSASSTSAAAAASLPSQWRQPGCDS